ncbi:MAG: FGGY-family carbohydrate kinase, partial [Pseudomonadota bacterium]
FFNGERTPNLPQAKGVLVGLDSLNIRSENILRSAVEGATFALKFGIDALGKLGTEATEIIATGGGANSPTWRQIIADVCNAPVVVPSNDEGAAFGAALQALSIVEQESDVSAIVDEHVRRDDSRSAVPRSSAVHFYEEVYQSYQRAVAQTASLYA